MGKWKCLWCSKVLEGEFFTDLIATSSIEEGYRKELKKMGMEVWLIDVIVKPFSSVRAGFGSKTTTVVEQIIGRNISFSQFIRDYSSAFN
jgi:hypothetical protein